MAITITITIITVFSTAFADNAAFEKKPMNEVLQDLQNYAQQVQHDWKVPGMSFAVVKNGALVYAQGFGVRDEEGRPVNADTIFDIASMTKSFTATLLAKQIDERKYNWGTKVQKLYPEFKLYDAKATSEFEVRDLIAHDSGLPESALDGLGDFGYNVGRTLYALRFIRPIASFRSQFAYQSIFSELAKQIIEKNSGESFSKFLHQQLFSLLGMRGSYLRNEAVLKSKSNVAQPYLYQAGRNYPYSQNSPYLSQRWALETGLAGGGIYSSVNDMAKWLIFNMNDGNFNGQQIIHKSNIQFIHTPQTIISQTKTDEIEQAYGEGWFIDKQSYKPYTVLYHAGGGTGMHGQMAYIPELRLGIVVLTNQYTNNVPEILTKHLFDLYINPSKKQDWNKIYLAQRNQSQLKSSEISPPCQMINDIDLKKYIGAYFNPVYGQLNISQKNNHLILHIGPQNIVWNLNYCRDNTFTAFWLNPNGMNIPMIPVTQNKVIFSVDENHAITHMSIPYLNSDGFGLFEKQK
ncbi:MAG TPA: serine hydrolase [Patescibacteria group bacterium]|nr:serine hydrolase [Gammaproteobacteria bacterium]HWA52511.1 serine hydrolase [Patescibacteria group bacterium]